MDTLTYRYRPRPSIMVLASAFFLACGVVTTHEASTNTKGLVINGIIHLGPQGAAVFYWVIVAICAAFVVAGIAGVVVGFVFKRHVVLSATSISVPSLWTSRNATVVALSEIQSATVQLIHKQRFLILEHPNGRLSIAANQLPGREDFDTLCKEIVRRR